MSERKSILYGALLGAITCLIVCAFVIIGTYSIGPGHGYSSYTFKTFDWARYLLYTFGAIGIALFAGGWTGRWIFNDMSKKMNLSVIRS
jgi:ABC-type antimicrobial peptide transport system permease subunit